MSAKIVFDVSKMLITMCPPLDICKVAPPDQSPCILEKCPVCEKQMWISEKKRAMRAKNPDKVKAFCVRCVIIEQIRQGIPKEDVELVYINKLC